MTERLSYSPDSLLRPEQINYCVGWHKIIGDKNEVLYNAMGPDINTVLLLTNARKIIGIDPRGSYYHSADYLNSHWDYIDQKPILRAGASGYDWGTTAENYQPQPESTELFFSDFKNLYHRGYWDTGAILRWNIDRLLFIELKKMNVARHTISIPTESENLQLSFDWAYPGEMPQKRSVQYLAGTLDSITIKELKQSIDQLDCFYQKSIPDDDQTTYSLDTIKPFLKPDAVVAIGYKLWGENDIYQQKLAQTLGADFKPQTVDRNLTESILNLPDDDPKINSVQYGMLLHVFRRS